MAHRSTSEWIEISAKLLYQRARRHLYDGEFAYNDGMKIELAEWVRRSCLDVVSSDARIMFSRDAGYVAAGRFKNIDHDRCWHLSVSYLPGTKPHGHAPNESLFMQHFFGENQDKVWTEIAETPIGDKRTVWHYRLFADKKWQAIPISEDTSDELLSIGWRLWTPRGEQDNVDATSIN